MPQDRGFLDSLYSPLTLAPMALGLSVLIVAWIVPPSYRGHCLFAGGFLVVIGLGIFFSQWLLTGEDPKRAQMRKEFLDALEAACDIERVPSQAAEKRGAPAKTEA